jgi:hypothetical protein
VNAALNRKLQDHPVAYDRSHLDSSSLTIQTFEVTAGTRLDSPVRVYEQEATGSDGDIWSASRFLIVDKTNVCLLTYDCSLLYVCLSRMLQDHSVTFNQPLWSMCWHKLFSNVRIYEHGHTGLASDVWSTPRFLIVDRTNPSSMCWQTYVLSCIYSYVSTELQKIRCPNDLW